MKYALLVAVTFVACVTTKYTLTNPSAQQYPPVPPDSVWIFTAASELDTLDFVRVAVIEATGSGEFTSQTGMLNAMRQKAGQLGANGILLPEINEPGAGAKVAAAIFGTGTQRKGNVVAVRVLWENQLPTATVLATEPLPSDTVLATEPLPSDTVLAPEPLPSDPVVETEPLPSDTISSGLTNSPGSSSTAQVPRSTLDMAFESGRHMRLPWSSEDAKRAVLYALQTQGAEIKQTSGQEGTILEVSWPGDSRVGRLSLARGQTRTDVWVFGVDETMQGRLEELIKTVELP